MYGLRKQAVICKVAREYGVEDLLPWSRKKSTVKQARKEELGLRVKGTGVGQRPKGHVWERKMQSKLEVREQAMTEMPSLIRHWKLVSCLPFLVYDVAGWGMFADGLCRRAMGGSGGSGRIRG